jgi:hypothetical protein
MKYQRTILPELADMSSGRRQNWIVERFGRVCPSYYFNSYCDKKFVAGLKSMTFESLTWPPPPTWPPLPPSEGKKINLVAYSYADTLVSKLAEEMAEKMAATVDSLITVTADDWEKMKA